MSDPRRNTNSETARALTVTRGTRIVVFLVLAFQLALSITFWALSMPNLGTRPLVFGLASAVFGGSIALFWVGTWAISEYHCTHCGTRFRPNFWIWMISPSLIFARFTKCPRTKKWAWCKNTLFIADKRIK